MTLPQDGELVPYGAYAGSCQNPILAIGLTQQIHRRDKPCLSALAEQASFAGASDPNAGSMAAVLDLPPANCPPVADRTSRLNLHADWSQIQDRGLSLKTVKNIHGALHGALEQAKINGYLRVNPSEGTTLPKMEKEELKVMESKDVRAFLQAIEGDEYELPLFVDLFTGLRQGELLGLTWDCVDFEKGTLLINKQHNRAKGEKEFHFSPLKNSRPRSLTAASAVMDALREQQRRQAQWATELGSAWDNSKNLVFTTQTGRYINNKTLWMNFKRIVTELGMPELRFHDLWHTFSINSLQAGDDIKTVQENLGHATASFTLATYAHATPGMKRESANRMDAFIRSVSDNGDTISPVPVP